LNTNLTIAIIDSGIDSKLIKNNTHKIKGIHIYKENDKVLFDNNIYDEVGHGTGIYNTIKMHLLDENVEFYIVKILDSDNMTVDEEVLFCALKHIYEHSNIQIINASLGVSVLQNPDQLKDICTKLVNSGSTIVSAFDNYGSVSFPAVLENVIGVTTGENIYNSNEYDFVNNLNVNICAFGKPQRIKWLDDRTVINGGDSFACAHISGIIGKKFLERICSHEEILYQLKKTARFLIDMGNSPNSNIINELPFKINKAAIFPFSKEIHSLIRFQKLVSFDIVDIYDSPRSGRVGARTNSLLDIQAREYIIKNIAELDYDSFDTFILGHTYDLSTANFKFNIGTLIDNLVKHNKQIYSFDDLSYIYPELHIDESHHNIYSPKVFFDTSKYIPFGKLYNYSKPILGVWGTSSKQGKFSLQLILRDYFLKNGYRVGQIGSEPSAYLFDMDYCIPFGYHSTLNLTGKQTIQHLNKVIYELCETPIDLIICGSQSGTITNDFGNIDNYPINQIFYLLSLNPDAVILCINPFDTILQIEKTIGFIESCTETKVIALCMYPLDWKNPEHGIYSTYIKISPEKFLSIKRDLEKKINKPVFLLGDEPSMEMLYNTTIDFFTNEQ